MRLLSIINPYILAYIFHHNAYSAHLADLQACSSIRTDVNKQSTILDPGFLRHPSTQTGFSSYSRDEDDFLFRE